MKKKPGRQILRISTTGYELARVELNHSRITVGRSPDCHVVLRAKQFKNKAFLIEFGGAAGVAPNAAGPWYLSEIDPRDVLALRSKKPVPDAIRERVEIGEDGLLLENLRFEWVKDSLLSHTFELDRIGHALKEAMDPFLTPGKPEVFELTRIRRITRTVEDVRHDTLVQGQPYVVSRAPLVQLTPGTGDVKVTLREPPKNELILNGKIVDLSGHPNGFSMRIRRTDILTIRSERHEHVLRYVPDVGQIPPERDYPVIGIVVSILLISLLGFAVKFGQSRLPKQFAHTNEPPKTIQVQVTLPPPPPPAPPPLPVPVSPPAVAAQPVPLPAPAPAVREQPKPNVSSTQAKSILNQKKQGAKKTRSIASAGDPMALLNSLSGKQAGKHDNRNLVDVDTTGAGAQAKLENTDSGIVVVQPKAGLDRTEYHDVDGGDGGLSQASTDLALDNSATVGTLRSVASTKRKFKSEFNVNGIVAGGSGGKSSEAGANGVDEESVSGGLDRMSVRRSLAMAREKIRNCYNIALIKDPKVRGKAVFRWHISPLGEVTALNLQSSTVKAANLEECVKNVIAGITFEQAGSKIPTTVVYPFQFQKSNR